MLNVIYIGKHCIQVKTGDSLTFYPIDEGKVNGGKVFASINKENDILAKVAVVKKKKYSIVKGCSDGSILRTVSTSDARIKLKFVASKVSYLMYKLGLISELGYRLYIEKLED